MDLESNQVTLIIFILVTILVAVLLGVFKPAWAGVRGKTAWDWVALLLVPTTVGFATFLISAAQQVVESDRQQEVALQEYVGRISDLALSNDGMNREAEAVGRAQTSAILSLLSGERSGRVILFLDEIGLRGPLVRSLENADLSGSEMKGLDLSGLEFEGANLSGADLEDGNFRGADFEDANLRGTDLDGADLRGVEFSGADLKGVELSGADLRGADLIGVRRLRKSTLEDACYDETTKLPSGYSAVSGPSPGCSGDRDRDTD